MQAFLKLFHMTRTSRKKEREENALDAQQTEGPSLDEILANLSGNDDAKDLCEGIRTLLSGSQSEVRKLVKLCTDLSKPVRQHDMETVREGCTKALSNATSETISQNYLSGLHLLLTRKRKIEEASIISM